MFASEFVGRAAAKTLEKSTPVFIWGQFFLKKIVPSVFVKISAIADLWQFFFFFA